jgi:hypothetical protein
MQLSEGKFKEREKLVTGQRWAPDTKTGPLTVGCKLTSTSWAPDGSPKPGQLKVSHKLTSTSAPRVGGYLDTKQCGHILSTAPYKRVFIMKRQPKSNLTVLYL